MSDPCVFFCSRFIKGEPISETVRLVTAACCFGNRRINSRSVPDL